METTQQIKLTHFKSISPLARANSSQTKYRVLPRNLRHDELRTYLKEKGFSDPVMRSL